MLVRSTAAICGAVIVVGVSATAAMALTQNHLDRSFDADKAASGGAIVGGASTYNPFKRGWREGGPKTATGERYDPSAWTAAIKTGLREKFGGVRTARRPATP